MAQIAPAPLLIYPLQLKNIYPHLSSNSGCYKKYSELKVSLGIKRQYITVKEFCTAEDFSIDDVLPHLVQ